MLNDKQRRFCEEYLIDLNATQAAIRAGYSEASARQIGTENLSKPAVQSYISELQKERAERTQITADRVLREVANIAFSNIADFMHMNADGNVTWKSWDELTPDQTKLVSEVSQTVTESGGTAKINRKIKMYCKDTALYNLMRHLGLYEKDNGQQNNIVSVTVSPQIVPSGTPIAGSENDVDLS